MILVQEWFSTFPMEIQRKFLYKTHITFSKSREIWHVIWSGLKVSYLTPHMLNTLIPWQNEFHGNDSWTPFCGASLPFPRQSIPRPPSSNPFMMPQINISTMFCRTLHWEVYFEEYLPTDQEKQIVNLPSFTTYYMSTKGFSLTRISCAVISKAKQSFSFLSLHLIIAYPKWSRW